jgi:hypothetical protein
MKKYDNRLEEALEKGGKFKKVLESPVSQAL